MLGAPNGILGIHRVMLGVLCGILGVHRVMLGVLCGILGVHIIGGCQGYLMAYWYTHLGTARCVLV